MKKLVCFLLCVLLCVLGGCRRARTVEQVYEDEGPEVVAEGERRDVAVLFTANLSDASVWDYPALAGLATDVGADYAWDYMALVDCGGALSSGEESGDGYDRVELMSSMGYHCAALDAGTLAGGVQSVLNCVNTAQLDWLCANLVDESSGYQPLSAWTVLYYGQTAVAFVGVSAPEELPAEDGDPAYSLRPQDWYLAFQAAVDAARRAGVDYVVALGCLGEELARELIGQTEGLDVYLDGSGQLPVEGRMTDSAGQEVFVSGISGGPQQAGKLILPVEGAISAELLEGFDHEDAMTVELIESFGYSR